MVMSAVAFPSVISAKVSGDTSLHLVKAMLMAFLVSSTFRVLGNFTILRQRRRTERWTGRIRDVETDRDPTERQAEADRETDGESKDREQRQKDRGRDGDNVCVCVSTCT